MSSVLDDKARLPDAAALHGVLEQAGPAWDAIVASAEKASPGLVREWKHYGRKLGWQLKLSIKKRAILYLIPHAGSFTAALALGPAAVAGLGASGLPAALVRAIEASPSLPEGKAARVEVKDTRSARLVEKLLAIKLASLTR